MIYLIKRYYDSTVICIGGYIIRGDAMIHGTHEAPKPPLYEQINELSSKDKSAVEEYVQFLYFMDRREE